jgi:hypothetical protein
VSEEPSRARLASALWESDRHRATLAEALAEWAGLSEPDQLALEDDPALRRLSDQILYRFMKLQDALGERLVPATLARLLEPYESWSMRDRLDRLEKLGFLDVDPWLAWRDVRNRLAHEYPDAPELRHAAVLAAIGAARRLIAAYDHWKARLPA